MRQFGKSIAICTLGVIMLIMVGCGRTATNGTEIISSKKVERISVELFDGSEMIFEGDAISQITGTLKKATLAEKNSVQDTPDSDSFGTIKINQDEDVIYYYQKNNRNYIEKPYVGVYEIPVDMNTFFQSYSD